MAARAHSKIPIIPDWSVVTEPAARRAIEGILAAGHYDSRFGGLGADTANVLAELLSLYVQLGRAPTVQEIAAQARLSAPVVSDHLVRLRKRDLILFDPGRSAILGAYPFTEADTGHSVTFDKTGVTLATMCAIDALGAGAMCREDVTIRSACRACESPVIARTADQGMVLREVTPAESVVWVGLEQSRGCAANSLCTALLFFCSDEHLARWRANGVAGDGYRLSIEEAFQVGKALFIDRAMMGRE
jgi:hypothetical protein